MANYTAADIKALRERTGAGMMDVKKALDEANGDAEKAIEIIRIKGLKGATKREGRSTAEGLVAAKVIGGDATGFLGCLCEAFLAQQVEPPPSRRLSHRARPCSPSCRRRCARAAP